ncbi:hypothetical protein LJB86_01600 [Deltaproteobacteria bacterium OttesenSCG-928-M10]|nr:hypothetical protein [Deltaproteobacteria bacterium OttesenSCG-928-M10]
MTKRDKRIERMRRNPQGWHIDDLKAAAETVGLEWTHDGGSHVVFRSPTLEHLCVPARRPIKPIYVRRFLTLIELVQARLDNEVKQ